MRERKLNEDLQEFLNLYDFLILLSKEYNPSDWGYYFPDFRTIIIYTLDESGKEISDNQLTKIALHEISHHIHFSYYEVDYSRESEVHGETFKKIYNNLLNKYYKGDIPNEILEMIKEEGLNYEPKSEKKRTGRLVPKRRVISK